jgi:4-hydroxybenzoate polyprenyltransferase
MSTHSTTLPISTSTRATHALAKSLRPHQWVKNGLLFGGLIFSQQMFDPLAVAFSVQAFLLFSLAASSIYLFNDLNDLEEDRLHPTKKNRPLAAGQISSGAVGTTMLCLATASLVGAALINARFLTVVVLYLLMNVAYSVRLKHVVILDVMIIALGFVLRAIAGAFAVGVVASPWLVLCTLTLALVVGFGKRRNELCVLHEESSNHRACLEGYSTHFLDLMMTISAGAAVVTYALYTMSDLTAERFGSRALVLTTPFVIYGIFRFLYLIHMKAEGGDPSRLFVKDRPILINGVLWLLACAFCVYGPTEWMPW